MLSDEYDLRSLTAQLGAPEFQQTAKSGEETRRLVHWGCGCAAIGRTESGEAEGLLMRWTRCDHHALAESAAFA